MKIILLFCVICCIFHQATTQNAQCSYENSYKDKFNIVTSNNYFYTCFLNTQYSNFNTPISNIVGQHGSGYTDNHVTYLQTSKGSKMRKFSSVFCQKFPGLLSIYVSEADIETIDDNALRNCRNLEIFGIEHSVMQQVPQNLFIGNLKLKVLTLLGNYLTTVPASFLVNQRELQLLRITQSRLSSLPKNAFNSLYKLQVLYLDSNKLQTIISDWFTNLHNLKLFSMSYNQITKLPNNAFKGIRNLEKILMSFNKFSYLDPYCFDGLYSLKKLNLGGNELTDLPANIFSHLRSLESLELNQNKLTTIHSDSFASHPYLKSMELQQNKINSFDEKVIDKTPVTTINLSHNICSTYILNRSNMKTNMKTCFDNYRQRSSSIAYSSWTSQAPVRTTTTTYRSYTPKATIKKYTTSWSTYKAATTKTTTKWTTTPRTTKSTTTVPETSYIDNYYDIEETPHVEYNQNTLECGRPIIGQGNIIGGKHVFRGDYPWTAALLKSESYFCGGVLVSNRKVITAAHCMQEKNVREPFRAQDIVVLLGAYDLNIYHEAGRSIFAVQKIEIHPDWLYQAIQYDADIAVLVLIGEVTFTPFIQPICLITSRRIAEITNGVAVGYGKSEDLSKKHENIPKVIDTPIYTNQQCFKSNQNLARISSGRTFCGGLGKGQGVCRGDSGGGVFVKSGNVYYLRGIVSSSLRDANLECDVDNYSVFTNVLKFNDWINGIKTEL